MSALRRRFWLFRHQSHAWRYLIPPIWICSCGSMIGAPRGRGADRIEGGA